MRILILSLVVLAFSACEPKAAPAPETTTEPAKKVELEPVAKTEAKEAPESAKKATPEFPDDLKSGEKKLFGAAFQIETEPITLASALEKGITEPVKVTGTINTVCKKKGCWFKLGGPGVEEDIRVRMKDYGFFVPKNCDGDPAVVECVLSQREMPQDEAQHYADDAAKEGETPEKIEGPQKVYEFTATAVEISKS